MSPLLRLGAPLHSFEIIAPTENDDLVTFGWSDFPLLGTTTATTSLQPTEASTATPPSSPPSCFLEMESVHEEEQQQPELVLSRSSSDDDCESCSSQEEESVEPAIEKRSKRRLNQRQSELKVSFSTIDVREYNVILGDHDFPEDGLPLSLGWSYVAHSSIRVDDYEELRFPTRSFPSKPHKLGYYERKNRLKRVSGYSESELRHLERDRQELASIMSRQGDSSFWSGSSAPNHDDDVIIRASPSFSNLLDYRSTV